MVTTQWRPSSGKASEEPKKVFIRGGRVKAAYPVGKSGDEVRHIIREHDQEADHLANLGAG